MTLWAQSALIKYALNGVQIFASDQERNYSSEMASFFVRAKRNKTI